MFVLALLPWILLGASLARLHDAGASLRARLATRTPTVVVGQCTVALLLLWLALVAAATLLEWSIDDWCVTTRAQDCVSTQGLCQGRRPSPLCFLTQRVLSDAHCRDQHLVRAADWLSAKFSAAAAAVAMGLSLAAAGAMTLTTW